MQKARLKSTLLSALLASSIGLTGAHAAIDQQTTYPVQPPQALPIGSGQTATVPELPISGQTAAASAAKPVVPTNSGSAGHDQATAGDQETARETGTQRAALYADLNAYVLTVINSYQGKHYPYLLNNDYAHYNGVTVNISYQGQMLLRAHPSGNHASHCVGITFETFFKAMQSRNKEIGLDAQNFNGMSFADLQDFMLLWYTASGSKEMSNPAVALVKYGLGRRITDWEDAKAGDFIDFSRTNGTGHSVIFLNWIRQNDQIIGLRYWSSQESTNGIGYREEYFNLRDQAGTPYGKILTDGFYIGRVGAVADYR